MPEPSLFCDHGLLAPKPNLIIFWQWIGINLMLLDFSAAQIIHMHIVH